MGSILGVGAGLAKKHREKRSITHHRHLCPTQRLATTWIGKSPSEEEGAYKQGEGLLELGDLLFSK